MLNIPVQFDDLLRVIDQLSAEQKRIIRQRLDEEWSARFGDALDSLHADMPTDISDVEVQSDIVADIDEVRRDSP